MTSGGYDDSFKRIHAAHEQEESARKSAQEEVKSRELAQSAKAKELFRSVVLHELKSLKNAAFNNMIKVEIRDNINDESDYIWIKFFMRDISRIGRRSSLYQISTRYDKISVRRSLSLDPTDTNNSDDLGISFDIKSIDDITAPKIKSIVEAAV